MNILKLTQVIMQKLGYDEATDTINLNADNISIKDPIVEINTAETGDGITSGDGTSGFTISRGPNLEPVHILYSETSGKLTLQVGTEEKVLGLTQQELDFVSVQTNDNSAIQQRNYTEQYLGI